MAWNLRDFNRSNLLLHCDHFRENFNWLVKKPNDICFQLNSLLFLVQVCILNCPTYFVLDNLKYPNPSAIGIRWLKIATCKNKERGAGFQWPKMCESQIHTIWGFSAAFHHCSLHLGGQEWMG